MFYLNKILPGGNGARKMNCTLFRHFVCAGGRVNNAGFFLTHSNVSRRYIHACSQTNNENENAPLRETAKVEPVAASNSAPIGTSEIRFESSARCCDPKSDDAKIREDAIASLVGLLEGKTGDGYSMEAYASDIRDMLSRGGFVVPSNDEIHSFAAATLRRGDRLDSFTSWVSMIPLATKDRAPITTQPTTVPPLNIRASAI